MGPAGNAPFLETSSNYKGYLWISWKRTLECEDSSTLVRVTYSGKETYLPQLSLILRDWPRLTSRATLARSSTTSTRPPTLCSPTCPRVTTRSAPNTGSSKTLKRILPAPFKEDVEELIVKKTITLDLYEILGKCTGNRCNHSKD